MVALAIAVAGGAAAQVTTEKSASVLVFPHVIADGTRDTVIQLTNTSNSVVFAHCFYVNGARRFPDQPPGDGNPPLWSEVDFDVVLTKQQPTHWVVSQGRLVDATDLPCNSDPANYRCSGAGIDPGRVPPVVEYFTGELKCIEVDPSGAPLSGNHIKGEATIINRNLCLPEIGICLVSGDPCGSPADCDPGDADVNKYNALGIIGNENNDGDNVLCLGGEPSEQCPNGAEYDACPAYWVANHFTQAAPDPVAGSGSEVYTSWTIVPCTQDFESQVPETVTIFIETWNEFEQAFSSSAEVTCWDELDLDEINPVTFSYEALGTTFAQSRLRATAQTRSGFLMVSAEGHFTAEEGANDGWLSVAAFNNHVEGARGQGDFITIPPEQIQ